MTGRRVIVFGGRNYSDEARLFAVMDRAHASNPIGIVVEGEAPGADTLARKWAESRGVDIDPHPANWTDLSHEDALIKTRHNGTKYDARAGFRRNQEMANGGADVAVAFPGGTGTDDMIRRAEAAHIPVVRIGA